MAESLQDPLIMTVRKTLTELGVGPTSRLLAGVSGGVDSMVMVTLLKELSYPLSVSHVNFQLRGTDSDADALLVRNWCALYNIPYFEYAIDTNDYRESRGLNTQSAAREIRYAWWDQLMKEHPFDFLATAHHVDDSIETFFINLLRGTGMKGLTGIPSRRHYFIRPLIRASRADIENYALKRNVPYRTDLSNIQDDYQRNRIRHHLIPFLKEFTSGTDARLDQTLHRLRAEWNAWEYSYHLWEKKNVLGSYEDYRIKSTPEQIPFVLRWLEEKGFPWQLAYDYVTAIHVKRGKTLVHEGYVLSRSKAGFALEPVEKTKPLSIEKPGRYQIAGGEISIEPGSREEFERNTETDIEFIDQSAVRWPLLIRPVLAGDRFLPLGMKGRSKKLQDLMVDLKMDYSDKLHTQVLVSSGDILWVIGKRLSEKAKVKPETKDLYKLSYKKTGD